MVGPNTPDINHRTINNVIRAMFATSILLTACGPEQAYGAGSSDTGDSGESGSAGESGDSGGPVMPGDDVLCVEMVPDSVTCWVDWADAIHARVLLECQAAEAVTAGAWSPAYEAELEGWGLVLCHEILGTAGAVCMFGESRVLLTDTVDGVIWVPDLSTLVDLYDPVGPPCGGCADDPTDGGDDCEPGTLACECSQDDLDGDGMVPPEGECFIEMECSLDTGICEDHP